MHVIHAWKGPAVFDADALTLFAGQPGAFGAAACAILTPHPGEMGRLLSRPTSNVEADRFRAARDLSGASGAVVVLKGAHTIIAGPDGRLVVSPVACSALATAGSGDTLGGIIGAFACGLPAFEAACAGVLAHGLAGEAWSRSHAGADRGMLASEIADALPALFGQLEQPR
jgi:NAD(P)H-hydrate epimerase